MNNSMSQSIVIEAQPSAVWAAMTRPEQIEQWLAQTADVDLREGGTYALRSGTPFVTGPHAVRAIEPERSLQLQWVLQGCSTELTWAIEPHEKGSRVRVMHAFPEQTPFETDDPLGGELGVFQEMWAYSMGLLKTYIELGEAKCRLSSDRSPAKSVTHTMTVGVSPQAAFRALTDPDEIRRWNGFCGADVKVEPEVGGRYSFGWSSEDKKTDGPGEIVEYEEGRKITYTWHGDPPTLVSWTVEPLPETQNATRITLVHSGFVRDQNMLVGYNLGWAGFLHAMALYLENGTAPDWLAAG